MIKIIETNLNDVSFQSRIIEVESWDYILNLMREGYDDNCFPKSYKCSYTGYEGVMRPRLSKVKHIENIHGRLMCEVVDFRGKVTKKLIQVIG